MSYQNGKGEDRSECILLYEVYYILSHKVGSLHQPVETPAINQSLITTTHTHTHTHQVPYLSWRRRIDDKMAVSLTLVVPTR